MRLVPTHAASDAQHRDGAAFIINLSSRGDVYRRAHDDCSFICAPTPARCFAGNWHAGGRCADGSGGRFHGSSAVPRLGTSKRLKRQDNCAGSTSSKVSALRDARAGVCGGACVKGLACFHGTLGTLNNIKGIEVVTSSKAGSKASRRLELWNRALPAARQVTEIAGGSIKIWGGYVATTSATSSWADQGLDRRGARGKFWGRNALGPVVGGLDLGDRAGRGGEGRNGGFPPFSAGPIGRVGMPLLECVANIEADQGFAAGRAQPAGLHGAALVDRIGRGVVDADRQGVAPPIGPRLSPSSKAQAIFLVSAALRIAGSPAGRVGPKGRLNSCVEMGSGVCVLFLASRDRREGADHQKRQRVGGQIEVLGWGRSAETTTLWGGLTRVN